IQGQTPSALDGVATALPALTRALKLQNRAARIGFDWPETAPVLDKIQEEIDELQTEIETGDESAMMNEMGDLLFSVVNLARHLKIDPEAALRTGNDKFERRFKLLETDLAGRGDDISRLSIEALESAWQNTKSQEIQ
ncbi:MAG: nucleoside triphosphate pyrophosphohydrolase, partial [Alphaproteobacteria bacterium]|nr:nucleoside triphosphate pyrophosphohydrolase [Alphaproteobacteria bacterium]